MSPTEIAEGILLLGPGFLFWKTLTCRVHSTVDRSGSGSFGACYSGLLRMADLLALQPNVSIPLYIVAPDERPGPRAAGGQPADIQQVEACGSVWATSRSRLSGKRWARVANISDTSAQRS
jgi:hypothetical protein